MRKIFAFIMLFVLFYSCQNDENLLTKIDDKNFVTEQEAVQIANIQFSKSNKNRKKVINKKSIFPVQDGINPTMYIINYGGNGFIIVSADNRTEPIFAYSDVNSFPLDEKYLPDGITSWLQNKSGYVKEIRKNNPNQTLSMSKVWNNCKKYDILTEKNEFNKNNILSKNRTPTYLDYTSEGDCNNGDNMMILTHYIAPLILTQWGQGNGYNNLLEFKNCTGNSNNNGRVLTGCVATAVAQVMKYHEFPNTYNWNNMPLYGATNETARLMYDLGLSQNLDMDYGCDNSGTDTKLAVRTFSNFGYVGARFSNYDYGTVRNEISFGHPVILRGAEKAAFLIFGSKSGHCWIADGLNELQFFQCIPDPNTPGEMTSRLISESNYLHMNWGWSGIYDGWFSSGNFNPGSDSYNWRPDMVTNIKT